MMRYKGKVAFWWYAIVVMLNVCTLTFIVQAVSDVLSSSPDSAISIVAASVFLLLDVFVVDSCIRNYVDIQEDCLKVRVSVFSESIPYSAIDLIKETNSVGASLSTSLDRLLIQYRKYNNILIAVKDKEAFLSEIKRRVPQISIERKYDK